MSSKAGRVFPDFGEAPGRQKAAGFQRLPPIFGIASGNRRSEPLGPAAVRPAMETWSRLVYDALTDRADPAS